MNYEFTLLFLDMTLRFEESGRGDVSQVDSTALIAIAVGPVWIWLILGIS
jgi:hypothetical protein